MKNRQLPTQVRVLCESTTQLLIAIADNAPRNLIVDTIKETIIDVQRALDDVKIISIGDRIAYTAMGMGLDTFLELVRECAPYINCTFEEQQLIRQVYELGIEVEKFMTKFVAKDYAPLNLEKQWTLGN